MRRWTIAAALLLLAAAGLLALVEERPRPAAAAVEFPRTMRGPEWERLKARRTLVVAPAPGEPPPDEPPERRDPFLAALPARPGEPVVVFEANALRHSRLGELFVACMLRRDPRTFEEIREETGLDVLKDVDRIAFAGDAVVVSGYFERLRWDRLERDGAGVGARYGEAGRIWMPRAGTAPGEGEDGAPREPVIGAWKDQLVVLGPDEESVRRALDQVEGRVAPEVALPDEMAYGEVYGVVPGEALRALAGGAHGELADRLAAAASRIEIHVDAMEAVAVVLNVQGEDPALVEQLSRALGGALAGARLEAQVRDDRQLADLLDQARVALEGEGAFSLEMAVPADRLEAWFDRCEPRAR